MADTPTKPVADKAASVSFNLAQLEDTLNEYLVKKAPYTLPTNAKEILVKIAPYLAILGVILSVPAIIALFGLGAFMSSMPFGAVAMATAGPAYMLGIVFLIASAVVEALAIQGLFARSKKAWNLMFYASLLNAVYALLSGNVLSMLLGLLISLYILFQVREYYK